jgi:hypothetical protein
LLFEEEIARLNPTDRRIVRANEHVDLGAKAALALHPQTDPDFEEKLIDGLINQSSPLS